MTPAGYFLWNGVHWEQVSEAFADDPDVVALYRAPVAVAEICESPFMDGVLRTTHVHSRLPAGTKLYAWVDDGACDEEGQCST